MSLHEYNTRTRKGDFQEALANLEQNITNSINSVKTEEINNLKDVILKRLQYQNVILRERCSTLEQKLIEFAYSNNLEQYGRRNNIVISVIPNSMDVNQQEESVTEILTDININVTSNDIKACHRIGKDARIGSTKTIICFINRKHTKQALYNKKKLSQVKKKIYI